jgi:hypothetical protein
MTDATVLDTGISLHPNIKKTLHIPDPLQIGHGVAGVHRTAVNTPVMPRGCGCCQFVFGAWQA